jgi:serine phosphatase RsbU (regulator of sigma subunit)
MSDGLVDVPNSFGIKTNERTMRKMMKSLTGHTAEQARDVIVRQLGLETSRRGREVPDDITFMVTRLRLQMARKRAA